MAFSKRCILRKPCKTADTDRCNALCPHYIAIHGYNGGGGRVEAANIPKDYRLLTLATSPAYAEQATAYETIERYAATFARQFEADGGRIKSLYLYSAEPGTGKTTTACALVNEWIIVHYIGSIRRGLRPIDRPAYFLDVNAWQSDYNEFNRAKVPDYIAEPAAARYYNAQQAAMYAPFAVLDDVGVRECTEAFRADLHRIVNHRVMNGLPTVYTSNVPLAKLNEVFREPTPRLVDRMRDMCVTITFEGGSKRGMRGLTK